MKQYIVSLSIGDNVDIAVNADNQDQAYNMALDIVHEKYKILDGNTPTGLGYVFLNETIEEAN